MKLGIFKTLGTTFAFSLRHFLVLYVLCLLVWLPRYAYSLFSGERFDDQLFAEASWENDLLGGLEIMITGFVTAVMVRALLRDRQSEKGTVFAGTRDALEELPTILGVSLCIAIVVTMLSVATDILGEIEPLAALAPGVIAVVLALVFAVAVPCAAVDNEGVMDCFQRSAQLTAGSRLRIAVVYSLLMIPLILGGWAVFTVFNVDTSLTRPPAIFVFLGGPVLHIFLIAAPVVIHEKLAGLDEGLEIGETAAVFD